MKNLFTLLTVKCFAIVYLTACTSIDEYGINKSVVPVVTNGTWKVNSYINSNTNQTTDFSGYEFNFNGAGTFTATKNGITENGTWVEDNISKKVHFSINTNDPVLIRLNDSWSVRNVSTVEVGFDSDSNVGSIHLDITNQ